MNLTGFIAVEKGPVAEEVVFVRATWAADKERREEVGDPDTILREPKETIVRKAPPDTSQHHGTGVREGSPRRQTLVSFPMGPKLHLVDCIGTHTEAKKTSVFQMESSALRVVEGCTE